MDVGTIAENDLSIFSYVETAEEAMALLHQRQVF